MTKLEQVARAIEDEIAKLSDVRNIGGFYGEIARAAVKALWEPSAEMLSVAIPFPLHLVIEHNDVDYTENMKAATVSDRMAARTAYQAMIDAILNEKPE